MFPQPHFFRNSPWTGFLPTLSGLCAGVALHAQPLNPADTEFFEKMVRPVLDAKCLECHSPAKKVKGGLSLDSKPGWEKGGDTGPALVPGNPGESLLLKAVHWADRDLQMPPKKKLSDAEIAVLEKWIQMGAPDPRTEPGTGSRSTAMSMEAGRSFWSYAPLQNPPVPAVRNEAWPRTSIDRFLLARMEKEGLAPAPDAEPSVLARRLSLQLTGLPPTLEQLDQVAAATDPREALAHLADTLLASPQFGEAWGRHWLDVARFAESSGGGRTLLFKDAWRYRDYVVESYNADRPFDVFIREQIAGDLLPAADRDSRTRQLCATGFLASGPTIYEEQDKQRLRFDVIDEQIDTLGKAFLGQTLGCARCHDHKFDPVSQRDYYALAGIFASTRTLSNYTDNVVSWVTQPLPVEPEISRRIEVESRAIADAEQELQSLKNRLAELRDRKAGIAKLPEKKPAPPLEPGVALPLSALHGVVLDDQDAKAVGEWKTSTFFPAYFGTGYLHDHNREKGAKSLTFTPKFPKSGSYEVRLSFPGFPDRARNVPVHIFHAMGDTTVHVDQNKTPEIEGRFVSLGTFFFEKDGDSYVIVSNEGTSGVVCVDALQFLPADEKQGPKTTDTSPATPNDAPDPVAALKSAIARKESQLSKLRGERFPVPVTMSVREEDTRGDTAIRIRGDVRQAGKTVPRGFPGVIGNLHAASFDSEHSGRMALADWLSSPKNPLTARVYVNRVWTWLFGTGIVRTPDNFATTGTPPTHPELLDHLASRFIEQGWSTKKLVREIVLSRAWQQVARTPAPTDPENRFFSHMNRRRLDAEQIRDGILSLSGQLDPRIGGPNIVGAADAAADSGDASKVEFGYVFTDVRRSLYTPAFRNNRLELFAAFDFGDINTPVGQRHASTVAPQALFFLNHPFVLEQARAAANRLLAEPETERLGNLFRRALSRLPTAAEARACSSLLSLPMPPAEAWAMVAQSIIGCIDFRYLD